VQNVIGTYYSTILRDCALENCTKVNTKSEQGERENFCGPDCAGTVTKLTKIETLAYRMGCEYLLYDCFNESGAAFESVFTSS
jgi:hypothetical protein